MKLLDCRGISEIGMIEVAKKFPLLEELDISFTESVSKSSLEVIGRFCPLLKSLTYSRCFYSTCDDEAIVIGKTMTELRHLKIYGNLFTDDGLLAILDGCPVLESLDLQGCLNFDLSKSLVERCHEKIKKLQFPFNYLDYYFYV
jgi:F-box/leucine-rich repeat protein 2/20